MAFWKRSEADSTGSTRTAEDARLNAPTGLKKPSSATVEALPYPAKRLSRVQEVQEWTEDPSSGGVPDSSQYPQAEGGMRSAARSSSTKNIPGKFPPGSTLSDPLLQWGDGEQASNTIEEHSMALDSNSKHGDGSSEPPQEPVTPAFTVSKDAAGVSVRSLGGRPGIHSLASSRMRQTSFNAEEKVSMLYKRPMVAEGEGSVFPIALPIAKRRAYEVKFIQKFDKLAINANGGEFWTIIDATWMKEWIDFVMGKRPSPGPISNYQLYDEESFLSEERRKSLLVKHAVSSTAVSGVLASHPGLSIKGGLQIVKDYRVIHPLIWFIFREVYDTDGSPEIFRWKSDVYSDEVTGVRKGKMVEEIHTKAVYELRRFSSRLKDAVEAVEAKA